MQSGDTVLTSLAEAVADGCDVDWDQAESDAPEDERAAIRQLRRLAAVGVAARAQTANWGPYELREEIGTGMFGTVYRAWDPRLEREVALKLLHVNPVDTQHAPAILREGRVLAKIRQTNVVTIFGAESHAGSAGIVMEFVTGRTLKDIVHDQGPFGPHEAAVIGRDLCRALAAVHQRGFVHRDVKAQNVMREAGGRTVLMDFGTGVAAGSDASVATLAGTPAYLAPEVLQGQPPSPRSDVYALGALLFFLVSGEFPVVASSLEDLRRRHATGWNTTLRDLRPDLPEAFLRAVDTAVALNPADRPTSAGEMQRLLEAALVESGGPRPSQAVTGRSVRSWVVAAMTVLTLAAVGGFALWPAAIPANSVAILPFRDLTSDITDSGYLADGITDDLAAHLSALRDLHVISGNSVRRLREQQLPETEIGAALGVATVLDGSVRQFGDRVRIVSRLVDATTGQQLWSESFERSLDEIADMQSEVARKIAVALKVQLADAGDGLHLKRGTPYEAFSLYSKGRYRWKNRKNDGSDLDESIRYYQQAIALAPEYALAYVGLADSYMAQGVYDIIPRSVAYDRAEAAASQAITLDGSLAEAHASLGYVQKNRFKWQDAEASFRRAIALKPSYAEAHHWLSVLLTQRGDFAQALAEAKAAILLDPLSLPAKMQLGSALLMSRRYDTARAEFQEVLRADPGIAIAHRAIAISFAHEGRYEEALTALAKASARMSRTPEDGEYKSYLGYILARAGRQSEALQVRSELTGRFQGADERLAGSIAAIDVALGRTSDALGWLEKAAETQDSDLNYLKVDPRWDPLRQEPRFVALQDRLGLSRTNDDTAR